MDRLWALKEEFDPFRWSRLGPGAGKLLSIFRYTFKSARTVAQQFVGERAEGMLALQAGVLGWIL
jgi:hypothetical protein